MSKINWVYHENYDIPLKLNHRFTSSKFSDLFYELKKTVLYKNAIITQPRKLILLIYLFLIVWIISIKLKMDYLTIKRNVS